MKKIKKSFTNGGENDKYLVVAFDRLTECKYHVNCNKNALSWPGNFFI